MRVQPNWRRLFIPGIAAMSILLVTPMLRADTFFWTGAGGTSWHASGSWSGPAGQIPSDWDDTAYVNGAANDAIVKNNYVIGFLVIQNAGHVTAGGNNPLSSLAVTSNGIHSGLALIKHDGSKLTVRGSTNFRDFQCENLKIQNGSMLSMREDATVQVDSQLILQAGGVIEGNGEFDFSQTDGILDPYNDGLIQSYLGTLRFYNSASSVAVFDIDGPNEDGAVEARNGSTLVFDMPIETIFNGQMQIGVSAEIQIDDDWTLASEAGSTLEFVGGGIFAQRAKLAGGHATLLGDVSVLSGSAALIAPATFGSGANVHLGPGTTLHVENTLDIAPGVIFTGSGVLNVIDGAHVELGNGLITNVNLNTGGVTVVSSGGTGLASVGNFVQTATGRSEFDLCSNPGGEEIIERLVASGSVQLDGELNLTAIGGCEPLPGDEFTIITATSITGTFATVTGLPNVELIYASDSVTVRIPIPCPADLDGDGVVNVGDLLELLGSWGDCGACPADINLDGVVDVSDLLNLLSAWGMCDG